MKFGHLFSLRTALMLTLAVSLAACGGSDEEDFSLDDEGESADAGGVGGGSATIDPATAGTIGGSISFEGAVPVPAPIDMSADGACTTGSAPEERVHEDVVSKDGKLANVFVYVSKGLKGKFKPSATAAKLEQKGCRYFPHVQGVMVGQTLQVVNDDGTLHNVHSNAQKNKAFNLAQPTKGMVTDVMFDQEEVMVPISCDVHGWMKTYIGVLPHPAFATSGADGKFSFQAPPGTYTVTAWHEKLGQQEQEVTIGKSETKDITFTFKAQ